MSMYVMCHVYAYRYTMNGQIWDDGDELFHKLITQPTLLLHGEGDGLEAVEGTQEMHDVRTELLYIVS